MDKVYVQNLGMIVTNKCNLDCAHCMRGCKNDKVMSKEVIDATMSQLFAIGNLALCGGEITLDISTLEYMFNYIIDNHIIINEVSAIINGTIYSEELLKLFDEMNKYISCYEKTKKNKTNTLLMVSLDKYHLEEIKKRGLEQQYVDSLNKYSNSIHFIGLAGLDKKLKLFREGNACNLDNSLTVNIRPRKLIVCYSKKLFSKNEPLCNIGPLLTVNTDGIVTECDASIKNQETMYNYGNVLDESIEEIALKRAKVLSPFRWYGACGIEIIKHNIYNK